METIKMLVEVEVPKGPYCIKKVWNDNGKAFEVCRCIYFVAGIGRCGLCDCLLAPVANDEFIGFYKLPACLEAGEEVQRG